MSAGRPYVPLRVYVLQLRGLNIEIKLFQKFTDYLLWLGLTTEAPAAKTVPFDQPTNVNIRYVGAPGKPDNNNIPTAEVVAPPGGAASGETSTAPKAYKICFAPRFARSIKVPRSGEHRPLVELSSLCGHGAVEERRAQSDCVSYRNWTNGNCASNN